MELKRYKIIIIGIILLVFYWLIEDYMHSTLYDHSYLEHISHMDLYEAWMRFSFSCLLIISSIFIQLTVNKIRESENKVKKALDLTDIYKNLFAHDIRNIINNIMVTDPLVSVTGGPISLLPGETDTGHVCTGKTRNRRERR